MHLWPGGQGSHVPGVLSQLAWTIHRSCIFDIDQGKAKCAGCRHIRRQHTLSAGLGRHFVNISSTRPVVKRGLYSGRCAVRMAPQDLDRCIVRTSTGTNGAFLLLHPCAHWLVGPSTLTRYNGFRQLKSRGYLRPVSAPAPAAGRDGKAVDANCLKNIGYELTGFVLTEAQVGRAAPALYWPVNLHHLFVPGGAL